MGYRLITVNDKEYGYIIGNSFLKVKGPEGEGSKIVPMHIALGLTKEVWNEALAARCSDSYCHSCLPDYMVINPAKVAEFIKKSFP